MMVLSKWQTVHSVPPSPIPSLLHTRLQCSYVLDIETNIPWTPSIELRLPVSIKAKENSVVREGQVNRVGMSVCVR